MKSCDKLKMRVQIFPKCFIFSCFKITEYKWSSQKNPKTNAPSKTSFKLVSPSKSSLQESEFCIFEIYP